MFYGEFGKDELSEDDYSGVCIEVRDETQIYQKIPEINFICMSHSIVYFDELYEAIITKLFKNTNIQFITNYNYDRCRQKYILEKYYLDNNIRTQYQFPTIKYKSGGKLGDFLNQLSVICENYYETGRRGELYIYNLTHPSDYFTHGLQYTYKVILSQDYIQSYKIYNGENVDVDLSLWRSNIMYFTSLNYNWLNIYNNVYGVSWGKHKWLKTGFDIKWNNKIIINIPCYRKLSSNAITPTEKKNETNVVMVYIFYNYASSSLLNVLL